MKPSEEFYRAAVSAGSLVIDCEYCGKTYFATENEGIYEEGELEELREKAEKEPDKYIEDPSYDTISWGILNGKQFVYECCEEEVAKFEQFIWNHRFIITSYIRAKADKLKSKADMEVENAKKLKDI